MPRERTAATDRKHSRPRERSRKHRKPRRETRPASPNQRRLLRRRSQTESTSAKHRKPPKVVRTNPRLWERVKTEVTKGSAGGKPGKWSARKAQRAVKQYEDAGGGYKGERSPENSLVKWGHQKWSFSSRKEARRSRSHRGRYLPEEVWRKLTSREKKATNQKKRKGTKGGRENVPWSKKIRNLLRKLGFLAAHPRVGKSHMHNHTVRRRSQPTRSRRSKKTTP